MKANMTRVVSTAAILFGSLVGASTAQANLLNGSITSATGTDVFKLHCGSGTVSARAVIQDASPSPDGVQISVHIARVQKRKLVATSATAPDIAFSVAALALGAGNYHFIVSKNSGNQVEPYQIDAYCADAAGGRIGSNDANQTQDDQDDT